MGGVGLGMKDDKQVGLGASEESSAERSWSLLTSWLILYSDNSCWEVCLPASVRMFIVLSCAERLSQPHRCLPAASRVRAWHLDVGWRQELQWVWE